MPKTQTRVPFYCKVVQGVVEQIYDQNGYCISQEFMPLDSADVDRRIIRNSDTEIEGELEDDEVIEHPEDLEYIMQIEKFQDFDMSTPIPPPVG
jgi:hypothetical protein